MPNCVAVPNLVEIGQTAAENGDFSIFQDGGRRHLGFFKFQIFNGRTAQRCRTASSCQIWSKSVKLQPKYGDFSIFPRWRPSAILDVLCMCVRTTHEGYLVAIIAVENLVGFDAVVLIGLICMFFNFTSLA